MQKMPYAEAFYAQAPSLALYPAMTDAEVDTVIESFKSLRKSLTTDIIDIMLLKL